jgi:hypothetical protein
MSLKNYFKLFINNILVIIVVAVPKTVLTIGATSRNISKKIRWFGSI